MIMIMMPSPPQPLPHRMQWQPVCQQWPQVFHQKDPCCNLCCPTSPSRPQPNPVHLKPRHASGCWKTVFSKLGAATTGEFDKGLPQPLCTFPPMETIGPMTKTGFTMTRTSAFGFPTTGSNPHPPTNSMILLASSASTPIRVRRSCLPQASSLPTARNGTAIICGSGEMISPARCPRRCFF